MIWINCNSSLKLIALLSFLFSFCSGKDEELILPLATIQISTPVENSIIRFGETLLIKGVAKNNTELHGYEIAIRKLGGNNLFFQHYHGHGNIITIEESWKNEINETADMEVVVSVILDHELHKQTKTVRFKILN